MNSRLFAVFDSFSGVAFGGSRAALVDNAAELDAATMQQIAIEFDAPATGFISEVSPGCVKVRFFSTQTEYPMCGHGTIALTTWLVERKLVAVPETGTELMLQTPQSKAVVHLAFNENGRLIVQLSLQLAAFEAWRGDSRELFAALRLDTATASTEFPIGYTNTDFRHLVIAVDRLKDLQSVNPDFSTLQEVCRQQDIDTVMMFCLQTQDSDVDVHCREFAPAVGADEVPATGTTNRALACYLHQYGVIPFSSNGETVVQVEQGLEMGRPSLIQSIVTSRNGSITTVRVGGMATKTLQGELLC